MSVQVKGSGTIGGLDEGLNVVGVVTSTSFVGTGVSVVGVVTATSFVGSGANLTSLPAANLTGTLPAISGANLTSLPAQVTLNNNADNRVITGGSGVNLYAESGFTYDGTIVQIPDRINLNTAGTYIKSNQIAFNPTGTAYLDHYRTGQDIQIRMSTSSSLDTTGPTFKSNGNVQFASGKGVQFTSSGEVLDSYEEGTWTPQVLNGWGILNPTYSEQAGVFVKVGKLVHVTFRLKLNGGSTNGNRVAISSFPFTPATIGSTGYVALNGYCDQADSNAQSIFCMVGKSGTTAEVFHREGTGESSFTGTELGNTGRMNFSGTFTTT